MRIDDDELIYMVRKKDETAFHLLKQRYRGLIMRWIDSTIKSFYFLRSMRDDAISLTTLTWLEAIETYRDDEGIFYAYAKLCVERELMSIIRSLSSLNAQQVNNAISLDEPIPGSDNLTLGDTLESHYWNSNPQVSYELQELVTAYRSCVSEELSPLDQQIWQARMEGWDYAKIASRFGLTSKQIDNILQRVKSKIYHEIID